MAISELEQTPDAADVFRLYETPLRDIDFIAFDTETTGINPAYSHLVELSGIRFSLYKQQISTFDTLIDPGVPIPYEATAVHGITDRMVRGKPSPQEAVAAFADWVAEPGPYGLPVLVAHNAPFDVRFINAVLESGQTASPLNLILDTLKLSRIYITTSPNHQLKTLVEHLGFGDSLYHRALADSVHVRDLLKSVIGFLPPSARLADLAVRKGFLRFASLPPLAEEALFFSALNSVEQAIAGRRDLKIEYSGTQRGVHLLTPRSVLSMRGYSYLNAYCHRVGAERKFRIDRIVKMEIV